VDPAGVLVPVVVEKEQVNVTVCSVPIGLKATAGVTLPTPAMVSVKLCACAGVDWVAASGSASVRRASARIRCGTALNGLCTPYLLM
jgi:hypothetical protein